MKTENCNDDGAAQLYETAKTALIKDQEVSVSLLQRRLKLGYAAALRLMEKLERGGVVTALDASGCRTLTPKYVMSLTIHDTVNESISGLTPVDQNLF